MCGIAGYVRLDGSPLTRDSALPVLTAMGDAMHHRGPDDTRTMLWENVGFVFKRLSIVDVAGGAQPFETADGSACAMVNGAIYNHREIRASLASRHALRTQSDCEVVPYLYLEHGRALFTPVNGMFAAALLDRRRKRLLLARDRLGVKPLFYCIADGGRVVVFASELKALFAHPGVPRRFDWPRALAHRSGGPGTRAEECPSTFRGIERVPAASIVEVDLTRGTVAIGKYWQLPCRDAPSRRDAAHYVDGYRALVEDSVRMRLMADVGYGLFLSGGIDSSMIAAIAARAGPFPTFSVLGRSTIGSGDAAASREVAAELGLPNHQVVFDEETIAVTPGDWRRLLWHCEMPWLTAEQLYKFYLHAFARERYPALKVMLLGQGSDEFSGGYMARVLGREAAWSADHWRVVGRQLRALRLDGAVARPDYPERYRDLLRDEGFAATRRSGSSPRAEAESRSTWDLYVEAFHSNLDGHLWHEDRTAAAHAIENRVPFLDYRVVEFLARIPEEHHAELFADKAILRRAAAGLLPPRICARPKGYFFYGSREQYAFRMMYAILTRNGSELIEQAIEGSARTGGPLDPDRLRAHVAEVGRDPARRGVTRLLSIVNMGLLADMADRHFANAPAAGPLPVDDIAEPEWARQVMPAPIDPEKDPADEMIVSLAARARVVVVAAGAGGAARSGVYLQIGARSDEIASPAWAQFLRRIDGEKTLGQISDELRLNRSTVRKHCRRALEDGILEARVSDRRPTGARSADLTKADA